MEMYTCDSTVVDNELAIATTASFEMNNDPLSFGF